MFPHRQLVQEGTHFAAVRFLFDCTVKQSDDGFLTPNSWLFKGIDGHFRIEYIIRNIAYDLEYHLYKLAPKVEAFP